MVWSGTHSPGELKTMKKLTFAVAVAAALLTCACSRGNEDQINNAELNQPGAELNELANDAANNAVADSLGNQQQQLDNNASADNTANPDDADEQNVSGM